MNRTVVTSTREAADVQPLGRIELRCWTPPKEKHAASDAAVSRAPLPPRVPRRTCSMEQKDVSRAMHCFIALRHAVACKENSCLLRTPYLRAPETLADTEKNHPNYVFLSRCHNWKHLKACGGRCDSSACKVVCKTLRDAFFHARSCGSNCKLKREYLKYV